MDLFEPGRRPERDASIAVLHSSLPSRANGPQPRTTLEVQQLRQKISLIARVFSGKYDLEILPSHSGWACGTDPKISKVVDDYLSGKRDSLQDLPPETFRPKQLFYNPEDLAHCPEDEVLGVLRHEVGHAKHSDYRLLFEGQKFAKDEGYLPTSWCSISNALEDPWVNNLEIGESEVVREQLNRRIASNMAEIVEHINSQPVTRQLGLNIVHYWATGQSIPTLKDQRVLEIFERIKPFAERYFSGASAGENFENLRDNIWPIYRELEEKACDDEALKELARKLSGSNLGSPSSGGEGQEGAQDQGPPAGGGEGLMSKLKKFFGGGRGDQKPGPKPAEKNDPLDQELSQKGGDKLGKDLKRALDQQAGKGGGQQGPQDMDLDALPPELQEALERIKQQLTSEAAEELEHQARANLDAKQAAALKRDGPRGLTPEKDENGQYQVSLNKPPGKDEIKKARAERDKDADAAEAAETQAAADAQAKETQQAIDRAKKLAEENERREMLKEGFDPDNERSLYRRFKELEGPMCARVRQFMRVLDDYLPRDQTYQYAGEHYSGKKINMRSLSKRAPLKDYRFRERREPVRSGDPSLFVELLIDNSGSMGGKKMEESLRTTVFMARVLREFNVPFAVSFFGDHVVPIMKFGQDYDDPRLCIKRDLVVCADASGGSTDMGSPLLESEQHLANARRSYPNSHGMVWVISDSGANCGLVGPALQEVVLRMQKAYSVMNYILSSDEAEIESAKALFGEKNVVAPAAFEDLPKEAFRQLRIALSRVLKRQRTR